MQALIETLFDAVYLVSVITIGILMIQLQGQPVAGSAVRRRFLHRSLRI